MGGFLIKRLETDRKNYEYRTDDGKPVFAEVDELDITVVPISDDGILGEEVEISQLVDDADAKEALDTVYAYAMQVVKRMR